MRCRKSRMRPNLRAASIAVAVWFAAITLYGCSAGKNRSEMVSATLSVTSYAQVRQRADPTKQASRSYYFPMLEIYNEAGMLIYRSHESIANSQILRDFPNSVRKLPPLDGAPPLAKILNEIPEFKTREHEIVGGKKLVILSVALENCEGCSIQEQGLDELRERFFQQPLVTVLEIKVAHP